jgi:chromosome segregation ATPase
METHTSRVLNLVNQLRSFADQACDAVLKESERADCIEEAKENEINELRHQVKEKEQALRGREAEFAKLEETSNAKFAVLESRMRDQETQLKHREVELQQLVSERDFLVSRLKETELAAEQAEAKVHQFGERLEAELSVLRLQLAKREESLAARELALSRFEEDLRTHIQNLQLRLQHGG